MPGKENDTEGRELIFSRLLDAPIKLVWEIWTDPGHLAHWWGPDGFTNTIKKMDVKPGGEWDVIMHGPDGTDYEVKSVFTEIVKHKKIVYEQLTHFIYTATIQFENRGDKTFLHWQMLFESKEHLLQAAKTYGVETGFRQHANRLIQYLSQKKILK